MYIHKVTDDQAFELSLRQSEARGLLYLLGMTLAKGSHGLLNGPTPQEESGIMSLVTKISDGLGEGFSAAFNISGNEAPQIGNQAADQAAGGEQAPNQDEGGAK